MSDEYEPSAVVKYLSRVGTFEPRKLNESLVRFYLRATATLKEIYNTLFRPMILASQTVDSLPLKCRGNYNPEMDTLDGFIYESLQHGYLPETIVEARYKEFLAEQHKADSENRNLPEEWVLKIAELSIPERAERYRETLPEPLRVELYSV